MQNNDTQTNKWPRKHKKDWVLRKLPLLMPQRDSDQRGVEMSIIYVLFWQLAFRNIYIYIRIHGSA